MMKSKMKCEAHSTYKHDFSTVSSMPDGLLQHGACRKWYIRSLVFTSYILIHHSASLKSTNEQTLGVALAFSALCSLSCPLGSPMYPTKNLSSSIAGAAKIFTRRNPRATAPSMVHTSARPSHTSYFLSTRT